jgi:hypothetical protein
MPKSPATVAVGLAFFAVTLSAQIVPAPVHMTAWAVNISGGSNETMEIRINNWSAPREREEVINAFAEGGQFGLLRQLQHVPIKGRIWIPTRMSLGWDLRYVWQEPTPEGGRRIVIAADRHVDVRSIRTQSRRLDYPFTFFEIRLNAGGEGEGTMAMATKLSVDRNKNLMMLEDYAAEPVRLVNVRVGKTS